MIKSKKTPILIHLPKTGGTSIRTTMGLPIWFKRHRVIGGSKLRRYIKSSKDPHVFAFIRDPKERAVSAYCHFIKNKLLMDTPPRNFSSVKRTAWTISTIAGMGGLTADKFILALLENDAFYYHRLKRIVPHFTPQAEWIESDRLIKKSCHYYDFSKFRSEYRRLLNDIGSENTPRLRHKMSRDSRIDADSLVIGSRAMKLLREFYKEDYALLDTVGFTYD